MKTNRLLPVLAALAIVVCGAGTSWAASDPTSLNGIYGCTGAGQVPLSDGDLPFTVNGNLVADGASNFTSGSTWSFTIFGFSIDHVGLLAGNYNINADGSGNSFLSWAALPPFPFATGLDHSFTTNSYANGVAQEFNMTATPNLLQFEPFVVEVLNCRHQ